MLLCFQAVGVIPVVRMCWNSLKKHVCALSGSILISSLGMLSGPGVLLLERFRRAVSKRTLVSFLERSVPYLGAGGGSIGSGLESSSQGMSFVRSLSGTEIL